MVSPTELHLIPETSGVYLMKGQNDEVLYVGKAGNLRTRVRSHIQMAPGSGGWYKSFVPLVRDIAYVVTDNEVEALLLEHNLIKKYDPPFNVKLKDDKRYPYIKVTVGEQYPRIYMTRTVRQDGSRYFGPYPHVREARTVLKALKEVFPLRQCRQPSERLKKRKRPCLNAEMNRCVGPCTGNVTKEEYDSLVKGVLDFLNGRIGPVVSMAEKKMKDHSAAHQYEKAAIYRDILRAVDAISVQQRVSEALGSSEDYIGIASVGEVSAVAVLKNRNGKLISGEYFFLDRWEGVEEPEQIRAFVRDYYPLSTDIPSEVNLPMALSEPEPLQQWLTGKAGRNVVLHVPQRGKKVRSIELARQNAHFRALEKYMKTHGLQTQIDPAIVQVQEILGLSGPPMRIEGYDIANISGKDAVGSMVVFQNGQPSKAHYRRFKIRTKSEPDDYAMMGEMLSRRFEHVDDEKFGQLPDLVLVDGGKGQLNVALGVLREKQLESVPTISIAKQEEELYLPGEAYPLVLDKSTEALRLFQRIRDESHRFAQAYFHKLRKRGVRASALDNIPGVGPARKKQLLRKFGSIKRIRQASVEDIAQLPGLPQQLAQKIKDSLDEMEKRSS